MMNVAQIQFITVHLTQIVVVFVDHIRVLRIDFVFIIVRFYNTKKQILFNDFVVKPIQTNSKIELPVTH